MSHGTKILACLGIISLFLIILTAVTYFFMWIDKANCDAMGGSYSIENDGYTQKTICKVTTTQTSQISERTCLENGVVVNCSEW
jgi:hypothetical protein